MNTFWTVVGTSLLLVSMTACGSSARYAVNPTHVEQVRSDRAARVEKGEPKLDYVIAARSTSGDTVFVRTDRIVRLGDLRADGLQTAEVSDGSAGPVVGGLVLGGGLALGGLGALALTSEYHGNNVAEELIYELFVRLLLGSALVAGGLVLSTVGVITLVVSAASDPFEDAPTPGFPASVQEAAGRAPPTRMLGVRLRF